MRAAGEQEQGRVEGCQQARLLSGLTARRSTPAGSRLHVLVPRTARSKASSPSDFPPIPLGKDLCTKILPTFQMPTTSTVTNFSCIAESALVACLSIKATPVSVVRSVPPMNQLMALLRVIFAAFILIGLASRSIGQGKDEMPLQAKLAYKLPVETYLSSAQHYTSPAMQETNAGLFLIVSSGPRLSFESLSIWDVAANKEVHRVGKQKGGFGISKQIDEIWLTAIATWTANISYMGWRAARSASNAPLPNELYEFAGTKSVVRCKKYALCALYNCFFLPTLSPHAVNSRFSFKNRACSQTWPVILCRWLEVHSALSAEPCRAVSRRVDARSVSGGDAERV